MADFAIRHVHLQFLLDEQDARTEMGGVTCINSATYFGGGSVYELCGPTRGAH